MHQEYLFCAVALLSASVFFALRAKRVLIWSVPVALALASLACLVWYLEAVQYHRIPPILVAMFILGPASLGYIMGWLYEVSKANRQNGHLP